MGGDQPFDSPCTRTRSELESMILKAYKEPRERRGIVVDDNNAPGSNRGSGRPGKGGSQTRNSAKKDTTADAAIILSLEPKKSSGLRARKAGLDNDEKCMDLEMDQKKQLNNLSIHENKYPEGLSTIRRKRGRPRRVLVSNVNAAASDQNGNVAKEGIVVEDSMMCEVDSFVASDAMLVKGIEGNTYSDCEKLTDYQSNQKNVSTNTSNTASAKMSVSKGKDSNSQHERQISKKAKTSSAKENSQTQDTTTQKMAESVCITKEAKMGSKQGCNMLDDQPLSKWFEELQSAGSSSVAKLHTESMKVKEVTKETHDSVNNEGAIIANDEVDTKSLAVCIDSSSALRESELPFVKNTSLWGVVESLDVFHKMPQKPHFRPLLTRKESSREGLAIACMVNFCSAVESISRLQFDDSKEKIDDILDSLSDLETHGFSVQVLRDRISKLKSIKEHHEQLHAEVDDINKQVALCDLEKSERDKEVYEMKAEMKKIEEKIAKAMSIKKIKDGEIAVLESRRQDVEETMRKSRSSYKELAAALGGSC